MDMHFVLSAALLGTGLAMDAFSVSVANGLSESRMPRRRVIAMAAIFAAFQFAMPLIGWALVHALVGYFRFVERFVPFIALVLLCYIGGKMIYDCLTREAPSQQAVQHIGYRVLLLQGVATSIDALSVGFTIEQYSFWQALCCAAIIAAVTLVLCYGGARLGARFCTAFRRAELVGGSILILIGFEIFLKAVFFSA